MGAAGSPYTRKMLALLRYRRVPYRLHWSTGSVPEGFPKPKVGLLPTFFLPDDNGELQAVTDSTPLIRRFEADYEGRSVIPDHPGLGFLNDLVEDYADEWLTKAMFHYRWAHRADVENAGPLLVHWSQTTINDAEAKALSDALSARQVGRLAVVGSNATTAPIIEASYARFVTLMDTLLTRHGFVLGARPASSDFAIFGQMSQLGIVDPTPAALTRKLSARVRGWIDRVEDLSGLSPENDDWIDADEAAEALRPLLVEIGRTYAPVMLANAKAVMEGRDSVEAVVDGEPWTQTPFRYQAKCLGWLRDAYAALDTKSRAQVDGTLDGTGCEALFA